jgi:hypothetical protein
MSKSMTKTCPACWLGDVQDPNDDEALCPLHAAAHDLLAAAEELKAAFLAGCGDAKPGSAKHKRLVAAGAALDSAVAKAKGGRR